MEFVVAAHLVIDILCVIGIGVVMVALIRQDKEK